MNLILGLILAMAATTLHAHAQRLVALEVTDRDTGRVLEVHHWNGRADVAGEPGHHHSVVLHNHTGERVLAVLSVDGIDAVTGETADHVLGPYERVEILGWRKSRSRAVRVQRAGGSYATRTGRPQNVGVIGIAVFREHRPNGAPIEPRILSEKTTRHEDWAKAPFDARTAQAMARRIGPATSTIAEAVAPLDPSPRSPAFASKLGTAHGPREWSMARTTHFERHSVRPDEMVEVTPSSIWSNAARSAPRTGAATNLARSSPDPFRILPLKPDDA